MTLETLLAAWQARWPDAIACWSRYVKLSEPRWCLTPADEKAEHLSGSFAMIRLVDHAVVISLRQVAEKGLERFAVEILAHEIGHHVYTPADLTDNARLLARIRAGLPTREPHAPLVSNLYEDLLINDRLQRACGLDMAGVYRQLGSGSGRLWTFYMRIYELLWQLDRGTLAAGEIDARLNFDAQLGARLIRSYARDWLDGGGRFAALALPYLADDTEAGECLGGWCDALSAGQGGLPDGLAEIDDGETEGAIHPALDPDLSGVPTESRRRKTDDLPDQGVDAANPTGRERGRGGEKSGRRYRDPVSYAAVLRATGVMLSEGEIISRYYRERAMPYLVPFPMEILPAAVDPHPEGTDVWNVGDPLEGVDWTATVLASPLVIPGVTTRERLYGLGAGSSPEKQPVDLYLGVDCSGSMTNPSLGLSYPVVAGTSMTLSALRAGAEVMVALSGEPGRTVTTGGFIRDEALVLKTLTGYLGTGYSFGIHRLRETFGKDRRPNARKAHIVVVSDQDIFSILEQRFEKLLGWDVAREAAVAARGGATYVLEIREASYQAPVDRMRRDGWDVYTVNSQEELVDFGREFARRHYERTAANRG